MLNLDVKLDKLVSIGHKLDLELIYRQYNVQRRRQWVTKSDLSVPTGKVSPR